MTYSVLTPEDLRAVVAAIPDEVRETLELKHWHNKVFVAGGFIRAIVTGEKINDLDLFTTNAANVLALHDVIGFEHKVHSTSNSHSIDYAGLPVQLIRAWFFDNGFACIKSFDFTVCQAAVWYNGSAWVSGCGERFYPDLAAKRLTYTNPTRKESFVGGSLLRVLKHYQMGYTINVDSFADVLTRIFNDVEPSYMNASFSLQRRLDPSYEPGHAKTISRHSNAY